jgi:hypothetical protein
MISNKIRQKLQDEELKKSIENEKILQEGRINYNNNILQQPITEIPRIELYDTIQSQERLFKDNLFKLGFKYDVIEGIISKISIEELNYVNMFWEMFKNDLTKNFNIKILKPDVFISYIRSNLGNQYDTILKGNKILDDLKNGTYKPEYNSRSQMDELNEMNRLNQLNQMNQMKQMKQIKQLPEKKIKLSSDRKDYTKKILKNIISDNKIEELISKNEIPIIEIPANEIDDVKKDMRKFLENIRENDAKNNEREIMNYYDHFGGDKKANYDPKNKLTSEYFIKYLIDYEPKSLQAYYKEKYNKTQPQTQQQSQTQQPEKKGILNMLGSMIAPQKKPENIKKEDPVKNIKKEESDQLIFNELINKVILNNNEEKELNRIINKDDEKKYQYLLKKMINFNLSQEEEDFLDKYNKKNKEQDKIEVERDKEAKKRLILQQKEQEKEQKKEQEKLDEENSKIINPKNKNDLNSAKAEDVKLFYNYYNKKYFNKPYDNNITKKKIIDNIYQSPLWKNYLADLNKKENSAMDQFIPKKGTGLSGKRSLKIASDKGMKTESLDRFIPFGHHLLHYPKLLEGMFSLRYKSGANHSKFPNLNISKEYKNFILDALNNKKLNHSLFNYVPELEKIHFKNLLRESGLSHLHNIKIPNENDEKNDHNRFTILQGEILAGNNNNKIIDEFKNLLYKFGHNGKLTKKEVKDALYTLNNISK